MNWRIVNIFMLIAPLSVTGQSHEWELLNPVFEPVGNYNMLNGIFIDKKNGWFIEYFPGRIWHTIDGGKEWKKQKDSSAVWTYDIDFSDPLHGWVAGLTIGGQQPFLWKTDDGGMSWAEIRMEHRYVTLEFTDSLHGFAAGEFAISRTSDGGETWIPSIVDSGICYGISDIQFTDPLHGWAVGGDCNASDRGLILKSINGGLTWSFNRTITLGNAVWFTDSLFGMVSGIDGYGSGYLWWTDNGGESWEEQTFPSRILDISFSDDSTGWLVGEYGVIWKTEDRGRKWDPVESGTPNDLNRVVFVEDGKFGYIFGDNNTLMRYGNVENGVKNPLFGTKSLRHNLFFNYPNPFNCSTNIVCLLENETQFELKVFDLAGRLVSILENRVRQPGLVHANWDGRDKYGREMPSGIYIFRLRSADFSRALKICLSR